MYELTISERRGVEIIFIYPSDIPGIKSHPASRNRDLQSGQTLYPVLRRPKLVVSEALCVFNLVISKPTSLQNLPGSILIMSCHIRTPAESAERTSDSLYKLRRRSKILLFYSAPRMTSIQVHRCTDRELSLVMELEKSTTLFSITSIQPNPVL